jgi:peptidoglycan/xylan/chitin deacetylase (PgdA/CDA1 family)
MSRFRRPIRALQALLPQASAPGCTVLCYHLVGAGTASPVDLPRELFRRQMEDLAETAEVLPLAEAIETVRLRARAGSDGRAPAATTDRPLAAVTFDDAYRNFSEAAFPILRELGIPVTLFVPVGFVEGEHPAPIRSAPLPALSWAELQELVDSGLVTVGSHTWSHPDLPSLPDDRVDRELERSRERLEERLGDPVRSFCYPRGLWSRRVERRVGRVYELAAVGGGWRFGRTRSNPLRIQRVPLRADGPFAIEPVLRAPVWLEEWIADAVRRSWW